MIDILIAIGLASFIVYVFLFTEWWSITAMADKCIKLEDEYKRKRLERLLKAFRGKGA